MNKVYMGIDPGIHGGIAITGYGTHLIEMPDAEKEVWEKIEEWRGELTLALIEKVHSMPKQGVASTFKFGVSYGFLRGCLVAAEIPFEEVTPQKWQKALDIPPRKKDEPKPAFKKRLRAKAQQLYPTVEVTLGTCDALLIATYLQRREEGRL